jgi:hypothetical protein
MRLLGRLRTRHAWIALAACCAVPLSDCSEDTTTRPPIVIVTPQPVRGVIAQTSFGNFEPKMWVALEVQITQRGVLDITVDWQQPDSWIYVYFGNTKCEYDQLAAQTCPFLLASETQQPKPRVLVTGQLEPATYYVVLYNVPKQDRSDVVGSYNTETVSLLLGLTVSASGERSGETIRLGRPTIVPAPHP